MQADPHDPLFESLLAFHRRTERHLAQFVALACHLEAGASPETSAIAAGLLRCFDGECGRRHAEEERELWPRMERTLAGESQRSAFRALRRSLAEQHREIERTWRTVRRPLEAIAEGLPRRLAATDIGYFRVLCAGHIVEEEAALHRVTAQRWAAARHETFTDPKHP